MRKLRLNSRRWFALRLAIVSVLVVLFVVLGTSVSYFLISGAIIVVFIAVALTMFEWEEEAR